jgi:tRNA(Leu) C34 or U34 (ribose-2'-O)-methylase TrmL
MKTEKPLIVGKGATPKGIFPAVCLINPKYSANVGAALRACSCFDVKQLWWTGDRVQMPGKGERLPREERMKGYKDVDMVQFDRPFDHFQGATPVAIELLDNTECIYDFEHPENAVYVFGPEDGNIGLSRRHCHRFVSIPTKHCTNLAAAVYLVLYDRMYKHYLKTGEKLSLNEERGFVDSNANEDVWNDLKKNAKDGIAFL